MDVEKMHGVIVYPMSFYPEVVIMTRFKRLMLNRRENEHTQFESLIRSNLLRIMLSNCLNRLL